MTKILFFDTKDYEEKFFTEKIHQNNTLIFKNESLDENSILTKEELSCEVLSVFTGSRVNNNVLKKFENLKIILTRSVGYSHIDTDYCKENDIIIANTPHYGDYTVSEFSFGILLNLLRKISFAENMLKRGEMYPQTFGTELFGKTIGIVGTGSIGEKSVKIANGFSMNILCHDLMQNQRLIDTYGVSFVDIDTLCKFADIIMLHSPLTPKTYHLINKEKISLMKDSAVIINTARGELIETEALFEALVQNKIAGAALDVLEFEETLSNKRPCDKLNLKTLRTSLINTKLMNLDNTLITPHIAYDTKEAINRILEITFKNFIEFINGKEIENKVT